MKYRGKKDGYFGHTGIIVIMAVDQSMVMTLWGPLEEGVGSGDRRYF